MFCLVVIWCIILPDNATITLALPWSHFAHQWAYNGPTKGTFTGHNFRWFWLQAYKELSELCKEVNCTPVFSFDDGEDWYNPLGTPCGWIDQDLLDFMRNGLTKRQEGDFTETRILIRITAPKEKIILFKLRFMNTAGFNMEITNV